MSSRQRIFRITIVAIVILGGIMGMFRASAQEDPLPTDDVVIPAQVPVTLDRFEPIQIMTGQEGTLSVFGKDFTAQTTIRLENFGLLPTTFVNASALTAVLPTTLPPGSYKVLVSDPLEPSGWIEVTGSGWPLSLTVIPQPSTAVPTLPPIPTLEPPTAIPGQPSLVIRNFSANPSRTQPGGTVSLTFEVLNQGNRTAQGINVSVDSGSKFVPANGQASATIGDLNPGAIGTVTLTVVTAQDAAAGANVVPLTMSHFDFSGQAYTSKGTLTVMVDAVERASQVTLARYLVDPNPVIPGQPVGVTVLVMNSGNTTASQVLLRIAGDGGILLAGPQGDTFPLGNLAPGASTSLELPLIVSTAAKSGPQSQPVTMTFLQEGESQTVTSSMTISVASIDLPEAVLLLENYDFGTDSLQPGEQFSLTLSLKNVGDAPALGLLVTFGTVESTGDGGSGSGGSGGGSGSGGSSSSTTPSNTFAPLGTGGTIYIGAVEADGGEVEISQDFIVNGSVQSGIYSLPVTLRYQNQDGTAAQDSQRVSVVVIVPPKLQIDDQSPVPEIVNVGEPVTVALGLTNLGNTDIELTYAEVTAENAEILDGVRIPLATLDGDDDTSVVGMVMPSSEGPVTITVTIHYLDDLNNDKTIVRTYEAEAVTPPPMPDFGEPPINIPTPEPEPVEEDTLGRALLIFLGLGS